MGLVCCLQLVSWYFSSESPRWLMSGQHQDQFLSLLFKASKQNGKLVKTSTLLALETQDEADTGEEQRMFIIDAVLEPLLPISVRNATFSQDVTAGKLLEK